MSSGAEKQTRAVVRDRSGGICEIGIAGICLGRATNISHRKAKGQGGKWTPSNCMDACGSGTTGCHGWVEANPVAAGERGLRVFSYETWETKPVLMRTSQWPPGRYLLRDDGTLTACP